MCVYFDMENLSVPLGRLGCIDFLLMVRICENLDEVFLSSCLEDEKFGVEMDEDLRGCV